MLVEEKTNCENDMLTRGSPLLEIESVYPSSIGPRRGMGIAERENIPSSVRRFRCVYGVGVL